MTPTPVAQELAEKVREACAKVCDERAAINSEMSGDFKTREMKSQENYHACYAVGAKECAVIVRSLDLSPFTQATGAGLPEEPQWVQQMRDVPPEKAFPHDQVYVRYVDALRAAATALQEKVELQRQAKIDAQNMVQRLEQRADNLQRELAEARKDAERYRWLRDYARVHDRGLFVACQGSAGISQFCVDVADEAIDAARSERGET